MKISKPKAGVARWIVGGLLLTALIGGLTLHELRERSPQYVDINERTMSRSPRRTHDRPRPATQSSAMDHLGASTELADETPPWEVTPKLTNELPAGTVPAWQVAPPSPDPSTPLPPLPVEPPNPAQHRLSIANPGDVDRDRPERTVPGLE